MPAPILAAPGMLKLYQKHRMPPNPGNPPKAPDARNHFFDPTAFTAVRTEDADAVANLKANLVALYQPVNSEETAF